MNAKTIYNKAYNESLEATLTPEGIAKLGESDGRKDARNLVRQVAGRVDTTLAMAAIKNRFPEFFSKGSGASTDDSVSVETVEGLSA